MAHGYTSYLEPKLTSTEERSFHLLKISNGIKTRIMDLSGVPIRISIDPKLKKIAYRSNGKNDKLKDFLNEKYLVLFKDLMTNFFCSDAFLYAVLKDDILYIYDIYTNSNWFSYDDLHTICNEYKYGEDGMVILEPLAVGNFTQIEYLELFLKIFKEDPKKNGRVHILPYYDLVSATGYIYQGKVGSYGFGVPDTTEETLFYNYTPPATNYNNHAYNWQSGYYDEYSDYYGESGKYAYSWRQDKEKKKEEEKSIAAESLAQEVLNFDDIENLNSFGQSLLVHPLNILTKIERKAEYENTLSHLVEYFKRKYKVEPSKSDLPVIKLIAYLWGIWSNKLMRGTIFGFLQETKNQKYAQEILTDKPTGYTKLFMALWDKYNKYNINRLSFKAKSLFNEDFVKRVLFEEYTYFDAVFREVLAA